jgi:DNA replication protein DnaC
MIDSSPLLEMHLRGMHLTTVLANYQRLLSEHASPLPYLSDLISLEAAKRQENGVKARIAAAHFPTLKTIESFDFTLQPELPKVKLHEHFEGSFVDAIATLSSAVRRMLARVTS